MKKFMIAIYILCITLGTLIITSRVLAVTATTTDVINVNLTVESTGSTPPPDPTPTPPTENTSALCTDTLDNDSDSLVDYDDPDCGPFVPLFELEISSVLATPNSTSSLITWETNLDAISTLSWGLTTDYEIGSSVESVGSTDHAFLIQNLEPNTVYYFKIVAHEDGNEGNVDSVLAENFMTLIGPDLDPPSTPINFSAVYDSNDDDVNLAWTNPSDLDFDVVRILRSDVFYPADENDGVFIYEGSGTSFEDVDIEDGKTYYYSIFAKDFSSNWSAGAIDLVTIPGIIPPECVGDECEPPTECIGPDCETPIESCVGDECDPFFDFEPPEITDPKVENLVFRFTQNGSTLFLGEGDSIRLDGSLPLKVSVNYDDLPEVLKTIGVTLKHPRDNEKIFSFILRVDQNKNEYAATIAPLVESGLYDVSITVLDHSNRGVKRIKGTLSVSEGLLFNTKTIQSLKDVVAPIGQTVGIAAGITQTVVAVTNVKSLYDVYLVVSRLIGALLGFLGIRRKSRPWGTVYDSVTKRPLDPAYVTVNEIDGEEKGGSITDLDGRYGFLLPKGVYKITANKTHYSFPSKKMKGKNSDELYSNLYFGEVVATEEGQIIDKNIPLDPVGFDWNEFEKQKEGLYILYSKKEKIKSAIFNTIYVFGLASTIFALVFDPNYLNASIMGIYIVMFAFQWLWGRRHRATSIFIDHKKNPLAFAIVRVFTAELNQQIKALVTDEYGRFYLLVSPGEYYITVEAKEADGSYKRVYKSNVMELDKGILPKDILISANA